MEGARVTNGVQQRVEEERAEEAIVESVLTL